MVGKKSKSPEKKDAGITPPTHSLRDDAEEQLARSRKVSSDLAKQSPEELIHELQVHQIELETQAEELRKSHLELEESWDKYLDLYDFAPVGYLTLNDKALITDVNLAGAALLCVERNKLVGAPFSKFIAEKDADQWHRYFVSVLRDDKKLASTLTLIRGDGSLLPVRVESIRLAGSSEGTTTVRVAISDITDIRRAEETLLEEQQFSKRILDSLPGIFYLYTYPENRMIRWNKQHETLLGYTAEELKGKLSTDLHLPEYKDAVLKAIDEVMEKGQSSVESTLLAKDGHLIPFFFTGVRFEAQGRLYFMGIGIDITERKRVEEALREREKFLNSIIENIPDMIFVKEAQELRFVRFNKAGEDLLGYSRADLYGKNDYDFFPKDEADFFTTNDREVLRNKNPLDIPDERIQTRDKGERILHTKKIPILDNEGNPQFLIGVSEDITERKRAEEALRTSEHEFRSLAEAMPQIVWVTRADGWNIYFNHQWVDYTGLTLEESYGHSWNTPFHPDDRQRAWDAWQRATQHQDTYSLECRLRRADGVYQWWLIRGVPLHNASGEILKWFGTCTNIEDLKQAENSLALTNRKLTLMNDVTYQYIQNKVTAIRGYTELSKDAKTEAEWASYIEKEDHILADIHQLIRNSKEYQAIGLVQPQWISVEQSIRIAVSLVSPNPDISIETAVPGLELYSDPLIEKIFANLIENAVIHGKTTRRIRFSCDKKADDLILICEDDGVGISAEVKAHIFDRGFSGNARFGLFFISECIALFGMTIAETGVPGKGARFEITVPKGMWRMKGAR